MKKVEYVRSCTSTPYTAVSRWAVDAILRARGDELINLLERGNFASGLSADKQLKSLQEAITSYSELVRESLIGRDLR